LDIPTAETKYDTYLERLINVASQHIERYCNRRFVVTNYVEVFDGDRVNQLLLSNFPVTTISEVCVDSARVFDPSSAVTDYRLISPNILQRLDTHWGSYQQSVRVSYSAGFAEIPADIEDACVMLVELRYRMKNDRRLGRESQSKAGEDVTFVSGWPQEVIDVLDGYKVLPMVTDSSVLRG
jgi:hypothetical protein